jgi:hypothetical protein
VNNIKADGSAIAELPCFLGKLRNKIVEKRKWKILEIKLE